VHSMPAMVHDCLLAADVDVRKDLAQQILLSVFFEAEHSLSCTKCLACDPWLFSEFIGHSHFVALYAGRKHPPSWPGGAPPL
jgi:hypothetical protein